MFDKQVNEDQIEIFPNGVVLVKSVTTILENGLKISQSFDGKCINPGENFSNENNRIQAICSAVHTPEVIAAYIAAQEN